MIVAFGLGLFLICAILSELVIRSDERARLARLEAKARQKRSKEQRDWDAWDDVVVNLIYSTTDSREEAEQRIAQFRAENPRPEK